MVLYLSRYRTLGRSSYPVCTSLRAVSGSNLMVRVNPDTVKSNSISSLHLIRVCNLKFFCFFENLGFIFWKILCLTVKS